MQRETSHLPDNFEETLSLVKNHGLLRTDVRNMSYGDEASLRSSVFHNSRYNGWTNLDFCELHHRMTSLTDTELQGLEIARGMRVQFLQQIHAALREMADNPNELVIPASYYEVSSEISPLIDTFNEYHRRLMLHLKAIKDAKVAKQVLALSNSVFTPDKRSWERWVAEDWQRYQRVLTAPQRTFENLSPGMKAADFIEPLRALCKPQSSLRKGAGTLDPVEFTMNLVARFEERHLGYALFELRTISIDRYSYDKRYDRLYRTDSEKEYWLEFRTFIFDYVRRANGAQRSTGSPYLYDEFCEND